MSHNLLIEKAHNEQFTKLSILHKKNTLPHALLFTGPSGIGKYEIAIKFAKEILGDSSTGADLYQLHPETALRTYSIDQVRGIQQQTVCTPYEGASRVFILNQADRLGIQASNAFLKLLEEPPKNNYFILVTSCSYRLLPTLQSRLQKFSFHPLPEEIFTQLLELLNLDLGTFKFMAKGSLGLAKTIAKYKVYLEALVQLIPFSYRHEYAQYRMLFDKIDDDKEFDYLEFMPFFEEIMSDFFHFGKSFKQPKLSWTGSGFSKKSLIDLAENLKEIVIAFSSAMKPSSCFERFFLQMSHI